MNFDLFVDTSRKGISMALSSSLGQTANTLPLYEEIVNPEARGETLGGSLDELLARANAKLDDIKRVMVTVGPGSFSGLRTGVAFCQGICFSGKRELFGVTTLQALEQFAPSAHNEKSSDNSAVVIRARNGFWYLRIAQKESFIETADVIRQLKTANIKEVVADKAATEDEELKTTFNELGASITLDTGKPLNLWVPLFDKVKPSLIQEANYIQPSYFEKLK